MRADRLTLGGPRLHAKRYSLNWRFGSGTHAEWIRTLTRMGGYH